MIAQLNAELSALKSDLKEKEQLNRISSYKLNDLKRSIKHNQLKPLVPKTDGEGSILSGNSSHLESRARQADSIRQNPSRKKLVPLHGNASSTKGSSKKSIGASIEDSGSRFAK